MINKKTRMVKTPLTLPEDILQSIDKLMGKRKRSRFVAEAARKELKRMTLESALQKSAGVWKDEDHPEIKQKGTSQWVRDMRQEADERFSGMTK